MYDGVNKIPLESSGSRSLEHEVAIDHVFCALTKLAAKFSSINARV